MKKKIIISITAVLIAAVLFFMIIIASVISAVLAGGSKSERYDLSGYMTGLPDMITEEMIVAAMQNYETYGIPTALTLAQIILESSGNYPGGLSLLAYECHNLFGIKGEGPAGYKEYKTGEQTKDGSTYIITAKFRKYNNVTESIQDHGKLLDSGHYKAYTASATTSAEWAKAIKAAGYATDVNYADKLISIMERYGLNQFDGLTLSMVKTSVQGDGIFTGKFIWPIPGASLITSGVGPRWGRYHDGIDIAASVGTPIYAADGGIVTCAGWSSGYGNLVIIKHDDGYETRYAHQVNGGIMVSVGQKVSKGQQIGKSGNTGRSTGPHLHFEIQHNGKILDPELYVSPPKK